MTLKRQIFCQLTDRQKRNRLQEHRTWHAFNPTVCTRSNDYHCVRELSPNNEYPLIRSVENDSSSNEIISDNSVESNNSVHDADNNWGTDRFTDYVPGESTSKSMDEQNIGRSENCFQTQLADCFIENNINNVQGNSMLAVLRSHRCLSSLPKDMRTLIKTCNERIQLTTVEPGEYWHVGFVVGILKELSIQKLLIPDLLEIDLSTDGVAAEKNGSTEYWPIQFRISNIPESSVLIAGVYRGKGKPANAQNFFQMLTDEVRQVFANGGIMFKGRLIGIKFRCFIADAPARAFILNHKGHMSSKPCSKCMVVGSRFEGRTMIFRGTQHRLRSDLEYKQKIDKDHHKDGTSPLIDLRISGVTRVPFDVMHLAHLGVMKKVLEAGVDGKYSRRAKWSGRQINIISARLQEIAKTCPRDFSRRPRPISEFKRYKATEFRQFLLYTGPVVLLGVMEPDLYVHFLLFHSAMRILSTPSASRDDLLFAEHALKLFVSTAEVLYGAPFLSYNIHGLLHVVADVRKYGPVDSYSAYPFESNMPVFRKYIRNQHRPLQQFARRLIEHDRYITSKRVSCGNESKLFGTHNDGPLPENCEPNTRQFKKLKLGKRFLSIEKGNNTCMLRDRSLCQICNILDIHDKQVLVVRKYNNIRNMYTNGKSSSSMGIFKCSYTTDYLSLVDASEVAVKCYCMPSWSTTNTDANRNEVIIMTLLHA